MFIFLRKINFCGFLHCNAYLTAQTSRGCTRVNEARFETVFAAHRLCVCEIELSDLYALREITLVGQLLVLSCTLDMIFGHKKTSKPAL